VRQAGSDDRVDAQTLFSVGSVSKVSSAVLTLRLVDAGKLDLDRDVNGYLQRWKVPANQYTAVRSVTLRGILSHLAGFTVPGFPDYLPADSLPTVLQTLDGTPPAKTPAARVVQIPGSEERYSGGGITVEQLVIEDVTGLDFPTAARRWIFEPLGMTRSTYQNPLPATTPNVARAHDDEGRAVALPRGWQSMPEMAASGLWTTPTDLAKLLIAVMDAYAGNARFLRTATAHQMLTNVGVSSYGLGPELDGIGTSQRFFHDGANDSYRARIEGHPVTGDGIVIVTNGSNGSALIAEVFRAIADAEGWPDGGTVRVPRFVASNLDELAGVYESRPVTTFAAGRALSPVPAYEVWMESDRLLFGRSGRDGGRRLIPVGPLQFVTDNGLRRVQFVRGYGGRIEGLILRRGIYSVEAVRR
jgi:CubicO group peptidase (beta-lactamase class C family)